MEALTQEQAVARAALITVGSYDIDLDLTRGEHTFRSQTTIRFGCRRPGADTFAELVGRPLSVRLNGRPLPGRPDGNRLPLADLAGDNELVVVAEHDYSHTGEGLHRFVDPADGRAYVYAMAFLAHAQHVFCCFDQPDLKAPVTLSVTVPPQWTVLSTQRAEQPEPGRWLFTETRPIATYLVTLCAGPYHSRYREHDGIRLGWHCRASLAAHLDDDADELFGLTADCLDAYHELFDVRYGFGDSYDQVFVPEFNAGAMENPGCVTYRDELLFRAAVTDAERAQRASTIAHEMAHMWFGDLVTMRWWDDLWLNESFATYLALRVLPVATRFGDAVAAFCARDKLAGYVADQTSWTHPVAPAEVADTEHALLNFDSISYPKGASVLRQLAESLGDEAFVAGLRAHFAAHAYGNATLADLIDALAVAAGRDLTDWARLWLRTAGVNTLRPVVDVDERGRYRCVRVEQTAGDGVPDRPHRLGLGAYRLDGGRLRREAALRLRVEAADTPVPELSGAPAADLLLVNDDDLTFATIRLTPDADDRLVELLVAADPLPRALLWSAALDATRAGERAPDRFIDLVAGALPAETVLPTLRAVFRRALDVADRFLPDGASEPASADLWALCHRMLDDMAGRDDAESAGRRLAAFRGAIECAPYAALATLGAWRAGQALPDGVRLDVDLRWLLLERLVRLGGAGTEAIEAEAAADTTAAGRVAALRCRSALVDADAKAEAWQALLTDRSRSNREIEAIGTGFWDPGQRALTAPYAPRYFAEIAGAAAGRPPEMVALLARVGFPRYHVQPAVVDDADALLARPGLDPALRRAVTAARDELAVALRARTGPH